MDDDNDDEDDDDECWLRGVCSRIVVSQGQVGVEMREGIALDG